MRLTTVCLIVVSVFLSAGSQLILKIGMTAPEIQRAFAEGVSLPRTALAIGSSPFVIAGIGCFGLSLMCWLFVLAKVDVTLAYPCVALGIVITVLAGHFLLGEAVSALRVAGISMVVMGVLVIAAAG
jgi:multidrug transporter EmrE-like cation transporter